MHKGCDDFQSLNLILEQLEEVLAQVMLQDGICFVGVHQSQNDVLQELHHLHRIVRK